MWVKARAVAGRLPDAFTVDVEFHRPLYLPSTVDYLTAPTRGGWDFAVINPKIDLQHLAGTWRARPSCS
jgi:hypothetical protein